MVCGHRDFFKVWMVIFMVSFFYCKLGFELTFMQIIHYFLWRIFKFVILYMILPNFLIFSYIAAPMASLAGTLDLYQQWNYISGKCLKVLFCVFFGPIFVPVMTYLGYISYYHDSFNFLHSVLIFELWIILYVVAFILA